MKLLAFSDLHEDYTILKKLIKRAKSKEIDIIVCAGDFTSMGSGMKKIMNQLDTIGKPVLIIHGNHESPEQVEELAKKSSHITFLHKTHYKFKNIIFLGYGGDGFSLKDQEFRKIARKWRTQFKDKKVVLTTHGPANGTKIDVIDGRHVGNKDYRDFIHRTKPLLAISGHLHETMGIKQKIDDTMFINPCWEGMVIEIG
ncbi:MAG: hypothetical protein CMH61_01370 [Nanoarchaeota archaeon]|nr:hypothetical protein [Nanoarchaeota archaeon]|tara:strand:+ start:4572 stop:5168 length:597 start_codon:yes stop_codon:yes gene_type:complete